MDGWTALVGELHKCHSLGVGKWLAAALRSFFFTISKPVAALQRTTAISKRSFLSVFLIQAAFREWLTTP